MAGSQTLDMLWEKISFEITTSDLKALADLAHILPEGTDVSIAALPKDTAETLMQAAIVVRNLGYNPVPHLTARSFDSEAIFERTIQRLSIEAKVSHALVLGGDRAAPAGPFESALDLIKTGVLETNGVKKIAIACYPEVHPNIPAIDLDRALRAKTLMAKKSGLNISLISQICFSAGQILSYAKSLRDTGIDTPLTIGIPGPASLSTLIKYAMICGVGPSMQALIKKSKLTKGLLTNESPDQLLDDLGRGLEKSPELGIDGIHFFTFGSLKKRCELGFYVGLNVLVIN